MIDKEVESYQLQIASPQHGSASVEAEPKAETVRTNDGARLLLNVSGIKLQILVNQILKYSETRLGKIVADPSMENKINYCDGYSEKDDEYYFDRDPESIGVILNFYRSGKLHLQEMCIMAFTDELDYWGIDCAHLASCCKLRYLQRKAEATEAMNKIITKVESVEPVKFGSSTWGKNQKRLWQLLEIPNSSILARVLAIISIVFIIMSTLTLTLSTVPELMDTICLHPNVSVCARLLIKHQSGSLSANSMDNDKLIFVENYSLNIIEDICIFWFTLEYLLRLLASPQKYKFIRSWLNTIDLLAILPYYVSLILLAIASKSTGFEHVRQILPVFRMLRILRILKLARHSTGLQSLGFTLRNSYKELGVLMLFLTIGVIIFSALIFVVENNDNQSFSSIPAAFWWALITMTTVGYGDVTPVTFWGKIVASGCAICGVLVIAMPIPIIVNNFAQFYEKQRKKEQELLEQTRNVDESNSKI